MEKKEKEFSSVSNYKGSQKTFDLVAKQIKERFGAGEEKKYDPYSNCLSFKCWLKQGYRVRRGEKALKSVTIIEKKDAAGVITKYPKTVNLFYYLQVEKVR